MKRAIFSGTKSILCKFLLCLTLLALAAGTASAEHASSEDAGRIEISFTYQRGTTIASNQLAVWVEDADGAVVRTLLVTDFTAGRRGYRSRTMSLPAWVAAASPESMTDEEMDTVSGATPAQGELVYVWDFTNQSGERVPEGVYTVHVEGTFYWESDVLYTAVIDTANPANGIAVEMERTAPDTRENENMISDVTIRRL